MSNNLSFGTADTTWGQHNLVEYPVLFNQEASRFKAVVRQGSLVNIVGTGYQLIPNEEAVKIADRAAKLAGLVPFSDFSGEWFNRMENHVILDHDGKRMHALYAMNKGYQVGGESMHLGVGIHNSIDGSTAFGCGVFSFRHACSNMVLAGTKNYSQSFDERKTVEYLYKRHTSSLDPAKAVLQDVILRIMQRVPQIISAYEEMTTIKANEELLKKLRASRLSKNVLPEYITEKEAKVPDVSNWQVYNDLTAAIWHNAKTGLKTKTFQFNALHKVMPLVIRRV